MKKLVITLFVLLGSTGVLFASGCEDDGYADLNKSTQEIVLTSNNLQLLKYYDYKGTTRFALQNLDGTVIAENMSRIELRNDFPEIENKYES